MRPRLRMTWVAGGAAAAVLAAIAWCGPSAAPRAEPPAPVAREAAAAVPASLAGTTPDGAARATADDALVLDPSLIRLFDYWLTTVGEQPIASIRSQVEHDLDDRLGPRAARQAKDLFARYLQFKEALKALTEKTVDVTSMIHKRMKIEQGVEAIELAGKPGVLKVLLTME